MSCSMCVVSKHVAVSCLFHWTVGSHHGLLLKYQAGVWRFEGFLAILLLHHEFGTPMDKQQNVGKAM